MSRSASMEPTEEPPYKKLKLSLERPYKDDAGEPIPVLLDITPEGEHIYEPREDPTAIVGENLRRVFVERGHDFFEKQTEADQGQDVRPATTDAEEKQVKDASQSTQPMTPEELFKMRMEILPQLHIALGELSQARDLLSLLLSNAGSSQQPSASQILPLSQGLSASQLPPPSQLPPSALTVTSVSKPPPIQSVQAFNTQLVIGGKDKALRRAADLFRSAAEGAEKGRARSERYWVDALKIRRGNWGLIPAPLPLGSAMGKGADKTSRDFLVSFSLEESPLSFRRRAIARMSNIESSASLEFPLRQRTRLQVWIRTTDADGVQEVSKNHCNMLAEDSLEASLQAAQAEVVQQEIFSVLIKEASNLPTGSAQVSERLIVLEAAQATELGFELIDSEFAQDIPPETGVMGATCDIIFGALHILLLRAHSHIKSQRLGRAGVVRLPSLPSVAQAPPILQPIIDLLQYQSFCERVRGEVGKIVQSLRSAAVPTTMRFNPVGENGEQVIGMLQANRPIQVGGEILLRIDYRYTLRFTLLSPATLTAHLPQATLSIASMSQLSQLLVDEVSRCLLQRICDIGSEVCEGVQGTWFVDLLTGRCIGRWEGRALIFRISFAEDRSLVCSASRLEREDKHATSHVETYTAEAMEGLPLFEWVRRTISSASPGP